MVIEDGVAVAAWGDVERKLELHSVRKSLCAALYGIAIDRGLIVMSIRDLATPERAAGTPGGPIETVRITIEGREIPARKLPD